MKSRGVFRPVDVPGWGKHFAPVDEEAAEIMRVVKNDSVLQVHTARNPRQLSLAWCLAQKLADAVDGLHDKEAAMDELKILARHCRYRVDLKTGVIIAPIPRSIAFESLDQVHFDRIFDRFIWLICHELVPGLEEEALRLEVLEMVDGAEGKRMRGVA
jgi:hypothetical protein